MQERGYCFCGCGQRTAIAKQTKAKRGDVAGQPVKYIKGHASLRHDPMWIVDDSGCWVWQWTKDQNGYGIKNTRTDGFHGSRSAHRWVYEKWIGPIPKGFHLHHRCGTRACVNPAHLEPLHPTEHIRLGARLTHEKAVAIRELVAQGWLRVDIAAAYGITAQHVTTIVKGKAWA